jgi:hypothetical protein
LPTVKKKEKRENKFKLEIPIYNTILYVQIGGNEKDIREYIASEGGIGFNPSEINVETLAITYELSDCRYLIWFRDYRNTPKFIGVLAHEVYHFVHFMMRNIGQEPSEDSEESYAYLVGYTVENISMRLQGKAEKKS